MELGRNRAAKLPQCGKQKLCRLLLQKPRAVRSSVSRRESIVENDMSRKSEVFALTPQILD